VVCTYYLLGDVDALEVEEALHGAVQGPEGGVEGRGRREHLARDARVLHGAQEGQVLGVVVAVHVDELLRHLGKSAEKTQYRERAN